jgi:CDP-diacylglycerol---glycerol-3-phosphate 3-phosphatidyltransferase
MKLPNLLTLARLVLAPVFVFFFTRDATWGYFVALCLAILFEITDLLDGILARRMNLVSDLGKFIDPLADSVSRFTIFLCLLYLFPSLIWPVAILFWRDSLVSTLRIMGATKGVIISARWSGKIKAWVQGTAGISTLCFLVWPNLLGLGAENVETLARVLMSITAVYTAYSLFDYLYGNREVIASLDG